MTNRTELDVEFDKALEKRDYHTLYNLINDASIDFLKSDSHSLEYATHLIKLNIDTLQYMGASKQYESAYELHVRLLENRNNLFRWCLRNLPNEVTQAFNRIIG